MWRRDYTTYNAELVAAVRANLVKYLISIAIMLRVVGSTLYWMAQGNAALCLQQMAPTMSVVAIQC